MRNYPMDTRLKVKKNDYLLIFIVCIHYVLQTIHFVWFIYFISFIVGVGIIVFISITDLTLKTKQNYHIRVIGVYLEHYSFNFFLTIAFPT